MDDVSGPGDWSSTMEPDDSTQPKSTLGSATIHPTVPQSTDGEPVHLQAAFDGSDRSSGISIAKDRLVFTVVEAAYLLNISRAFAYELVARGELPAIRLGRRIVIPRVGLEKLLGPSHC
jgi:excisionase family DNA binding protein